MQARTRCYPVGGLTPVLCLARNAQSSQVALGAISMAQLLDHLRPRVRHYATPLVAGMPRPTLKLDAYVEHALVTVGASLASCTATTDSAFYAWVSAATTTAVLAHHATVRRLLATRRNCTHRSTTATTSPVRTARSLGSGRAA